MFTLAPEVSAVETEYGVVLLDRRSGEYWNLNASGALVLRSVSAAEGLDAAVTALVTEFDIDRDTAIADAREVLDSLLRAGLIVSTEPAGGR